MILKASVKHFNKYSLLFFNWVFLFLLFLISIFMILIVFSFNFILSIFDVIKLNFLLNLFNFAFFLKILIEQINIIGEKKIFFF